MRPVPLRLRSVSAPVLLAALLAACSATPAPPPMSDAPDRASPGEPSRFGRLQVDRPAGLAWASASLRADDVTVTAEPWDGARLDGDDRERAAAAVGADLVRRASERPAPPWWTGGDVLIERAEIDLDGGRTATVVLSVPGRYALEGARRWEAVLDADGMLVRAQIESRRPPDELRAALVRVLGAVRTAQDDGFGGADWLYAGPLALDLEPAPREEAGVGYTGPGGALQLSAQPTPSPPDPQSLRERAGRARQLGGVEVLRSRDLAAGGLDGEEVVADVRPRGEPSERTHTWEHVGPQRSVTIDWTQNPAPPQGAGTSEWDALLGSLRPTP